MSEHLPVPDAAGAALTSALQVLARTPELLVALDFDGVIAPLVDRAEDSRPLPGSAAAMRALAGLPRTAVALISGRALDSLRAVANPDPRILLIGSHGAETWTGPAAAPLQLTDAQAALRDAAIGIVRTVAADSPGTHVELKPAGVVLHTRTAEDSIARSATERARALLSALDGVHVSDGKRVLETSVLSLTKADGVHRLRALTSATATLFAGDDVTDENAFAVLKDRDVGIKVGPGQTRARYRVDSPVAFERVLQELLALRRRAVLNDRD